MSSGATPDTVLKKTALILNAFTSDDGEVALTELVRRTNLHKATVFRLCRELVEVRLLDRTESGYKLSSGMFELGMRAAAERSLLELAMPFLQDLYERTHEIVHLGVREDREVVYVAKIGGHRQARSPSRLGGRMPMHCTAIGKAILGFDRDVRLAVLKGPLERRTAHTIVAPGRLSRQLAEVRRSGFAVEREESALGLTCIAAPVFGPDGIPHAAISLAGPTTRFRPDAHRAAIIATAAAVSAILSRREEGQLGPRSVRR